MRAVRIGWLNSDLINQLITYEEYKKQLKLLGVAMEHRGITESQSGLTTVHFDEEVKKEVDSELEILYLHVLNELHRISQNNLSIDAYSFERLIKWLQSYNENHFNS